MPWFVDETYVKVARRWTYLYRAIDQHGQVIDVWLSRRRDLTAARAFFSRVLALGTQPVEVTTDRAPAYPRVLDEFVPGVLHVTEPYANNAVEVDHGRLKARASPDARTQEIPVGVHPCCRSQVRSESTPRHYYEIAIDQPAKRRLRAAFDELMITV